MRAHLSAHALALLFVWPVACAVYEDQGPLGSSSGNDGPAIGGSDSSAKAGGSNAGSTNQTSGGGSGGGPNATGGVASGNAGTFGTGGTGASGRGGDSAEGGDGAGGDGPDMPVGADVTVWPHSRRPLTSNGRIRSSSSMISTSATPRPYRPAGGRAGRVRRLSTPLTLA